MSRNFRTPDYEATLKMSVSLDEALPTNYLARFAAAGEWCLVCLACYLKRLHVLWPA